MMSKGKEIIMMAKEIKQLMIEMDCETEETLRGLELLGWLEHEEPVKVRSWAYAPDVLQSGFLNTDTVGWTGHGLPFFPTVEVAEGYVLLCTKVQKERFLELEPDAFLGIAHGRAISKEDIDEILVVDEAPEEIPESKPKRTRTMPPRPRLSVATS